jgi:predicted 3-demethylubiquinone-9 3-methyltransferase (glyoxalase superfamily)
MNKVTPFLTFKDSALEAMEFYVSIFKNSSITSSMTMPGSRQLLHGSFILDGQPFMAMDGGDYFNFAQGNSLFVTCQDQEEVDYFWEKLGEGGKPGQCGWLEDKFGVSWQIIPTALGQYMSGSDPARSKRVHEAMLAMGKIDIEQLAKAYDNE